MGASFDEYKQVDMKPAGQPKQPGCGEIAKKLRSAHVGAQFSLLM